MKRREFIQNSILTIGGLMVGKNLLSDEANPDLVVVKGSNINSMVDSAFKYLGGIKSFIKKGDIVVIKPNIGWDRSPEYAANTNPFLVGALVKACFEAGAKSVKVFDHTVNNPQRCYKNSGIKDEAEKYGATVTYIDESRFKEVNIKGEKLKSWPVYKDVLEADKVINVPVAKTHGIARLTLGIKNLMGVIGGSRRRLHQDIDQSLADLTLVIKPTITVLDAIRILTANGPTGGDLKDVKQLNTIVIGRDMVAVDAFGCTFFGIDPKDIGYIMACHKMGTGRSDLNNLKIKRIEL
jgi:uncharacterized protein (DUF362 family)